MLNEFRSGRNPILIATDVASRGLGRSLLPCGQRRGEKGRHRKKGSRCRWGPGPQPAGRVKGASRTKKVHGDAVGALARRRAAGVSRGDVPCAACAGSADLDHAAASGCSIRRVVRRGLGRVRATSGEDEGLATPAYVAVRADASFVAGSASLVRGQRPSKACAHALVKQAALRLCCGCTRRTPPCCLSLPSSRAGHDALLWGCACARV